MSLLIRGSLLSLVALSYHYLPSLFREAMFIQLLSVKFEILQLRKCFLFSQLPKLS